MSLKPIVALDLGSTKVACAIALPHERSAGFELLGTSLSAYPVLLESWLNDPLIVGRTIEQALEATAVRGDFHRAVVTVSHPLLTSERVRVSVTLGDEPVPVRAHDLERLQTLALDQTLGVDREPLLIERLGCAGNGFDGVRDPRGLSASRLFGTFQIVTMPVAARRVVVQAVESAGLEVAKLTYTLPMVLASLADEETQRKRVLLVDVGGLSSHAGLFVDGVLQASTAIAAGGLTLAMDIARSLGVTMEQAVTWGLEGTACRKAEVRAMIEQQRASLQQGIEHVLQEQPQPDVALVTGRGALADGFVEWVERTTGIHTSLCRSSRTSRFGDLSRQVGLTPVLGILEHLTVGTNGSVVRSPHLINRLIDQTRTILTEYF